MAEEQSERWGGLRVVSVQNRLRNLVSKEKRRFKDERFDLDLTYITDRIIAMGFPATGSEASYRNDADEVYNFFESRHSGHYKFYNLCSERQYPKERFHGRVSCYPFDDHNPPPLGMFMYLCRDVEEYLAADERNVVAIHCKAGKGRTGVMITAFLLWAREWDTPVEAMAFYGFARTNNQKGITIPSQRVFIEHWNQILKDTDQFDEDDGEERYSVFGEADAAIKAAVSQKLGSLKEGGEEDDSESDPETDSGSVHGFKRDNNKKAADPPSKPPPPPPIVENNAPLTPPQAPPPPPPIAQDEDPDSPDEDEEEDDAALKSKARLSGRGFFGRLKFGGGGSKLSRTAPVCTPIPITPLMDRSWNDRNRDELPCRGQIPPAVLKCITGIRIRTTPRGGYEPIFRIHCGAVAYDSKDMIPSETYNNQAVIDIPLPDCPVIDEVLVVFYQRGTLKKKKMLQFWFHTSFVDENNVLVVCKEDMDKAVKDKKHKKFAQEFKIEILLKDAPDAQDPRPAREA